MSSSSAFDFLLGDLSAAPTDAKKEPELASFPGLDWLVHDSDITAPHPDAFELELESLAALGGLDSAELAALTTTVDSFNPADFALYSQYRSGAHTYSAYSGYGGAPSTITASSETLSAYGSAYEPYDKITEATAAGSGAQHLSDNLPSALSSLFQNIDIDLSAFNLPAANIHPGVEHSSMVPRLSLDIDSTNSNADIKPLRSRGTSSAYDSASPPFGISPAGVAPTYRGAGASHPSLAGGLGGTTVPANTTKAPAVVPKVESTTADPGSDTDPRKKYQCSHCPRAFARAFNLKTHMATHDPNRVKTFVCRHSGCGRSFSRKHDLGRHLVSIHQDNSAVGPATSSSTSPVAASGPASSKSKKSAGSIGVGSGEKQRVWCDSCGRGWLAGSRDTCECDAKDDE